jgi:hypothetical protein
MTLNEFKAWLEGFQSAIGDNPPTAEQWESVKAQFSKVVADAKRPEPIAYPTMTPPGRSTAQPSEWPKAVWTGEFLVSYDPLFYHEVCRA